MKIREIFRIPYGYIENTLFESKKNLFDALIDGLEKLINSLSDRLDKEIERSTNKDNETTNTLQAEIARSKYEDKLLKQCVKVLMDGKTDRDAGTYEYTK